MPVREYILAGDIPKQVVGRPVGCLFAFISKEDAHSPVMIGAYDELAFYLEDQVPLFVIDSKDESNKELLDSYFVYGIPTLLWIRKREQPLTEEYLKRYPAVTDVEILLRVVGIVNEKKLEHEADKVLEGILG